MYDLPDRGRVKVGWINNENAQVSWNFKFHDNIIPHIQVVEKSPSFWSRNYLYWLKNQWLACTFHYKPMENTLPAQRLHFFPFNLHHGLWTMGLSRWIQNWKLKSYLNSYELMWTSTVIQTHSFDGVSLNLLAALYYIISLYSVLRTCSQVWSLHSILLCQWLTSVILNEAKR